VLKVENVSFRYADNEPYLFENINLEFKDNEAVVLTGQSGRGKSTLLNILTGSLKPETGTVSINGHDIYQVSPSFIRGLSGIVRQDDVLFAGSIGENISFFDESPNMELIEQCAKMAQIHDDILKMPMGYETLIGDMGNILSGGQKQRVILARALYKRPKILFLDEASSHLDVENEQKINHNLKSLGIMKIMVAHRQETIQSADKILNLG
ncbi:ATP-binding cassette domain-containing protein, partial [Neisseria gonorrhoeae]